MHDNRARGIDVSAIGQGQFNWVRWEGHIDFAMAKATEGIDFTDPEFTRNWAHMTGMGIGRIAYHFGHVEEDPAAQAHHFTSTLLAHGYERCAMALDIEDNGPGGRKKTPAEVSFWSWTFMRECHRLIGARPVRQSLAYSFEAFIRAGNLAMCGRHPLWVAEWGVPEPSMPVGPWRDWLFWQYAAGRNGGPNLDLFNGTREELTAYLAG